ncbi:MAG TPA: HAMP domain-containing sensor histidine kinase [Geodermatophilus sp.]|nr:HAMP domain-containing sensor histidine kinase [Geodermatophilus sp.]
MTPSAPASAPGARAGAPGIRAPRVPLRVTLVALLVALVALALTATGAAAASLLHGYLESRQDDQLLAVLQEAERSPAVREACLHGSDRHLPAPYYVGCLTPGDAGPIVLQGPMRGETSLPDLTGRHAEKVLDAGSRPVTVRSEDGHTYWRVAAAALPGGSTVVVGTDLERDKGVIGRLVAIEITVGLIVLAVLGVAGYLLVRNSLRPLAEVERTARAIAAGDLSQRVPAGDERTEVGRLSTALNGMLSRIESAFRAQQTSEEQARTSESRMRRFVADASHELRTPLTSIRGFAELYRQGAVRTPEETTRLMQRIESEGARMGLLVEDLLQLARLDQHRPLSITPVDLAEVAGDAVHDARVLQPERPISLVLDDSLSELPVVLGDEARLRQVVGNLVTNVLVHTPVLARVTVSLSDELGGPEDEGGVVVLRVADEGPGMAAEDAERVFERFYRADPSRAREAGGTGLGLAIVASLVAAHGGTVDLTTAPGDGATFTVRLPRSGPPSAGVGG